MSQLTDLFTNIANAIRTKTGGTDVIKASDFPSAIEGIPLGGSKFRHVGDFTYSGSLSVFQNDALKGVANIVYYVHAFDESTTFNMGSQWGVLSGTCRLDGNWTFTIFGYNRGSSSLAMVAYDHTNSKKVVFDREAGTLTANNAVFPAPYGGIGYITIFQYDD